MADNGQGKISFFKRFYVLMSGRFPISEKTQESVTVSRLKKQIRVLEDINDKYQDMINDMTKQLKVQNEQSIQDKMLDMAGQFLMPKNSFHPQQKNVSLPEQQRNLSNFSTPSNINNIEVDLEEEQIKEVLKQYEPSAIKTALALGEDFLFNKIKEQHPTLSENTIVRGIEIAKNL